MIRKLKLVLGDQLNLDSELFDDWQPDTDRVWMAEIWQESTAIPVHKQRIALFLSGMRHFAEQIKNQTKSIDYLTLEQTLQIGDTFEEVLSHYLQNHRVQTVEMVLPGSDKLRQQIQQACQQHGVVLNVLADSHFIAEPGEFSQWLAQRKKPTMEYWSRHLRQRTGILMEAGKPIGGQWNFDADNRKSFGSDGPDFIPPPLRFAPDAITNSVIRMVEARFKHHPGALDNFGWAVTSTQAQQALADFIQHRLPRFGDYQDAMWPNQAWLYHSTLSAALNLKLLNPTEVIQAAEAAYAQGQAPLNAVEGFVRQILGWREYVRGLYWSYREDWLSWNALDAQQPLPDFYWTAKTDMVCMRDSIQQVLDYGYGHHIQRLMVTGLYSLLLGVQPQRIHEWYLAMFVDAVEWVEIPNVIGMSQFADGGIMASKPYIASGQYIQKMSGYCANCRFKPKLATGEQACPFTTLYWVFIDRHQQQLSGHPRLGMQVKHWLNKSESEQQQIRTQANHWKKETL